MEMEIERDSQEQRRMWIADHSLKHAKMLAEFGYDMPSRKTTMSLRKEASTSLRLEDGGLVDALCRHREILRRETNFLMGEVNSRALATLGGRKAYRESIQRENNVAVALLRFVRLKNGRLGGGELAPLCHQP
ncbi:hypothetical protein VPH35_022688 [Triticum aestivum]